MSGVSVFPQREEIFVGGEHPGREQRICEFHEENTSPVLGLREGAWLEITGNSVTVRGTTGVKLFQRGADPIECRPDESLSLATAAS